MLRSTRRRCAAVAAVLLLGGCGCEETDPRTAARIPITTASDEARSLYLEGREMIEALQVADAYERFARATEIDPDFALAWMAAATAAPSTPEFFSCLRRAVAAIDHASDGERMLITAFEAGVNGEPDVQLAELEHLATAYPGDERAHSALADHFFAQQQWERAAAGYRRAIDINPDFSTPYNQLGYALRFAGDLAGAEAAFRRYIELVPDQPNPYDSYAELLMKMGRFEDSIASYQRALAIEPAFVPSYIGIANNYIFLGRTETARRVLKRIDGVARTDGERRVRRTWTAATHLHDGDIDSALAEIRARYEIAAAADDKTAMAFDLNFEGDILLYSGRIDDAEARYRDSVSMIDSSNATEDVKRAAHRNLYYELARVALERGDLGRADELAAEYGAAVAPFGIRAERQQARELAGLLALAGGEPQSALFELAHADQQNPQVLMLNARAFAAAGDREAARAACRQVVSFNQLSLNLAYARRSADRMLAELGS